MTVQNVIDRAYALMFTTSTETTDYDDYIVQLFNVFLAELFDVNNGILLSKEEEALTSIPTVTSVSDTLTYEDEVTAGILPYGIAGTLMCEDQSTLNTGIMHKNKYEELKESAKRGYYVYVTDNYTGEEEE